MNDAEKLPEFCRDEGDIALYKCGIGRVFTIRNVHIFPFREKPDLDYYAYVANRNGSTTRDPFQQTVEGIFSKHSYQLQVRYK